MGRSSLNAAILGLLIGWIASTGTALAGPLPGSALESPIGRFLLGETPAGLELMSRVLGRSAEASDLPAFLESLRSASPRAASELEARIAGIRERSLAESPDAESDRFSAEERAVLREVAERELRVDPEWRGPGSPEGEIPFVGESTGLAANRKAFLTPEDEAKLLAPEEPGETAPADVQAKARRGFKDWYDDAQDCLQSRPAEASRAAEWRYLAQQWIISGSITTGSYLIQSGFSHIEWSSLGVDLLMSMLSQGVGNKWMSSRDSLQVRWLKVLVWGHVRADIDAEVYRISPWTDTHGVPLDQAVDTRREFNYAWNARMSWLSPLMFTVLTGMECLLDQQQGPEAAARLARFRKGSFVFRTGVSMGNSLLYYKLRPRLQAPATHP
jgi:hypothetical protein